MGDESGLGVVLLLDVVVVDEHLLQCLGVTRVVKLLQKIEHLVQLLQSKVTKYLLLVQVAESGDIIVFLLVLQVEASLHNILALELLHVVRVYILLSCITACRFSGTCCLQEGHLLGGREMAVEVSDLNVPDVLILRSFNVLNFNGQFLVLLENRL